MSALRSALALAFSVAGVAFLSASTSAQTSDVRIDSRIGAPLLADGKLFVGTESGQVLAFDAESGRELWRDKRSRPTYGPPLFADGVLYLGGQDGALIAYDAETGEKRWRFQCGRTSRSVRDIFVNGAPTLVNDTLFFSSEDFNFYAVEAASGEELWHLELEEEPQALAVPIVDDVAYIGTWDGHLYAIDVERAEIVWRSAGERDVDGETQRVDGQLDWVEANAESKAYLPLQTPYVTAEPIVLEDQVIFADWAGYLVSLDRESGKQKWMFKPETLDMRATASRFHLAEHGGTVFYAAGATQTVHGVDASNGELVWTGEIGSPLVTLLQTLPDLAVVLSIEHGGSGGLSMSAQGLDLERRELLWKRSGIGFMPHVSAAGDLIFGDTDGVIRALDPRTGEENWRLAR